MRVVNDTAQRDVKLFEEFNRLKKKSSVFSEWWWQIGMLFASQQLRKLLLTQCLQFLDSKTESGVEVIKPEQSTFMV